MARNRLTRDEYPAWRLVAFALPSLPTSIVLFPALAILPTFYAKHTGISFATIGVILIASKVFDAVSDPIVGHLSDITRSPMGSRKPWIIAGAVLTSVGVLFLFTPSSNASWVYFAFWFIIFYLAITLIEIPLRAWSSEISRQYDERSKISTYLAVCGQIGLFVFAALPLLAMAPFALLESSEYNSEFFRLGAWVVACLTPLTVACAVLWGPTGTPVETVRPSLLSSFRSVYRNRPFLFFLCVFVIFGLGNGMFMALTFLYADSYLMVGDKFFVILLVDATISIAAMPLWLRFTYRVGKHHAWAAGVAISSLSILFLWFIQPGPAAFMLLLAVTAIRAVGNASLYVLPGAIVGDIVDYEIMKTGANRAGNYFSVMALVAKLNGAIGGGLGFLFIDYFDYQVGSDNTAKSILALQATVAGIPVALMMAACLLLLYFPLTRRRHDVVRRRIQRRQRRAA